MNPALPKQGAYARQGLGRLGLKTVYEKNV